MSDQDSSYRTEEFKLSGGDIMAKIKELVHEGNVRRLIVKQEGRTILEVPLTAGVVGFMIAPVMAALGALAALIAECTIVVERDDKQEPGPSETQQV